MEHTAPAADANLEVFPDGETIARAVAVTFVKESHAAIAARGRFAVVLAGGSTPKRAYEILATDEFKAQVEWDKVHIFFGDERTVPPDHADSNFRMASEALLNHAGLPHENIHRMVGEGDAAENARAYETQLRDFFDGEDLPRFDLVLLGMGDDGHTASLFPETDALEETQAWVIANRVEKFDAYRITLSAPAINAATHVIFSVTGANKAARLVEVLHGARDVRRLPSQLIAPTDGRLDWFLDEAAAANL